MKKFSYALYQLQVKLLDGLFAEFTCQDGSPFDLHAYSRFKYGYLPPASEYGAGLAALIADVLLDMAGNEPIVIVSAPYKYLPTASEAIARVLCYELSHQAVLDGREPPVLVPFHKAAPGDSSYAHSSERERERQLQTLGLHLDESLIPGSHVLVVDDIRITGAAQRASAAYLEPLMPASIWYLQAASLPEEVGRRHPSLENDLNSTIPPVLVEIAAYARGGALQLNTRLLRFILECENEEEFWNFMEISSLTFLREIHQAGVGSGQVYYEKYRRNLEAIFDYLHQFGRKPVS